MEPREETDKEKSWKQKILAETSLVVKNPPTNAGDTGSIPGPGRSQMPWDNCCPCVIQSLQPDKLPQ